MSAIEKSRIIYMYASFDMKFNDMKQKNLGFGSKLLL